MENGRRIGLPDTRGMPIDRRSGGDRRKDPRRQAYRELFDRLLKQRQERYIATVCKNKNCGVDEATEDLQKDIIFQSYLRSEVAVALRAELNGQKDDLTGLLRLEPLKVRYEIEINYLKYKNNEDVLGVIVCDLDNFRQANERLGHQGADEILRQVAQKLKGINGQGGALRRPSDVLSRTGGDEFFLLFRVKKDKITEMLVRIKNSLAEITYEYKDEAGILKHERVGVSMGVRIVCQDEVMPFFEKVRKDADEAAYSAKHEGRNTIVLKTDEGMVNMETGQQIKVEKNEEWYAGMELEIHKRIIEEAAKESPFDAEELRKEYIQIGKRKYKIAMKAKK